MLRLPDGMRNRLKADADANGRSMNAEIVDRLEQSVAVQLRIGEEYRKSLATATDAELTEFQNGLNDLLETVFPRAVLLISPEEHWRTSMEAFADLPASFKPLFREQVLKVCRMLARDPDWQPPVDTK